MPDFSKLLNRSANATPPPTFPIGTYTGILNGFELKESSKKKTPFVQMKMKFISPGEDVDPAAFEAAGGMAKLSSREILRGLDFYLTEAAEYMLTEFLQKLGINVVDRSFQETLPETVGKTIRVELKQVMSEDGKRTFNEIGDIIGLA